MSYVILIVVGLVCGHLIHRFTPHLLGMEDRSLPFKWPVVELLGAALLVIVALNMGLEPSHWHWLLFALLMLAVGAADAHTKYIPTRVCYAGVLLGLALNAWHPEDLLDLLDQYQLLDLVGVPVHKPHFAGIVLAALGALTGYLLIQFIRGIFKPLVQIQVMGAGDALLMLAIGAFIGPKAVVFSVLPACLFGIVIGGIRMLIYKVPHSAFGPALAMGALAILMWGPWLIAELIALHAMIYELPAFVPLLISLVLVAVLFLMLMRLRRKAAEYERIIEEDYAEIDKKMQQK